MNSIERAAFGRMPDGRLADIFILRNSRGLCAKVTNFGITVVALEAPDRNGNVSDVVLGYDDFQSYCEGDKFFGAIIGRFGNRIGGAAFRLNDREYSLPANDGDNHLHGGSPGFDKRLWDAEILDAANSVRFTLLSADGDQGYPGNLQVEVLVSLDEDNCLNFDCRATCDQATPISLTHHSYFNLAGTGDILDHELRLEADAFTPAQNGIPDGSLLNVDGTPFDFREFKPVGRDIQTQHEQIVSGRGYDHNFVARGANGKHCKLLASVLEKGSGRRLRVYSNAPGIQFYSGNFMNGDGSGKGRRFDYRSALCLEPQEFPDAPNKPEFPSSVLQPGDTYLHLMKYQLDTL